MHMDIKQNSTAPGSVALSLSFDFILLFKLVFACPSESLELVSHAPNMLLPSKEIWLLTIFYGFWLLLLCWIVSFCRVEKPMNMPRDIQLFFSPGLCCSIVVTFQSLWLQTVCCACMYHMHAQHTCTHMHTCVHTCTHTHMLGHLHTKILECVFLFWFSLHFPHFKTDLPDNKGEKYLGPSNLSVKCKCEKLRITWNLIMWVCRR